MHNKVAYSLRSDSNTHDYPPQGFCYTVSEWAAQIGDLAYGVVKDNA